MYVMFYLGCLYVRLLTTVEGAGKDRIVHDSDRQTIKAVFCLSTVDHLA